MLLRSLDYSVRRVSSDCSGPTAAASLAVGSAAARSPATLALKLAVKSATAVASGIAAGEVTGVADLQHQVHVARPHVLEQLGLVALDVRDVDVVDVSVRAREDRDHLLLDRHRRVQRLLQQLDEACTPLELRLRHRVELGTERRERFELAELREVELQRSGDRLHRLDLRGTADSGDGDADVDRGTHTGLEEVVLQVDLAVGDRDDVRGDVRGDVTRLGLDDRQRGERARTQRLVELGGPFQQTRVEVEDVAGVCLAARRPAQQQRHLAVRLGLLRQVVVDDERVLAVLHPVLPHRATGVRREVLEHRFVVGRRAHHDRVLQRAVLAQRLHDLRDGRTLLTDRDVDALHALTLLVQDRVDGDGRLAGLAVADDQLALTPPDGGHRVDGLDAGLQRLVHRLAPGDAGRLHLEPALLGLGDRALGVDRHTECVDDAAEQPVADRNGEDAPGRGDRHALFDVFGVAEDDGTDRLFFEVQRETLRAALELEQLVDRRVGQAGDAARCRHRR